ncbi:hypothetical protein AMAG_07983 [Allomyces macrogynus ATCC 38327]|uniref:Uncharacterized protein n=1 Tax=Allomyces macrogynus (strain ATCC 38327) TaxID=578462 RepID=A0A0L0SJZ4_ALLM3|nr:hypothetical protein AMAG_07983 [Allomyces macrogynus ATCC 38327]|eukprot:KNE62802.1 hypothetical protein AMAG_07983 [Allomyces macrogynus ATCC 38327]
MPSTVVHGRRRHRAARAPRSKLRRAVLHLVLVALAAVLVILYAPHGVTSSPAPAPAGSTPAAAAPAAAPAPAEGGEKPGTSPSTNDSGSPSKNDAPSAPSSPSKSAPTAAPAPASKPGSPIALPGASPAPSAAPTAAAPSSDAAPAATNSAASAAASAIPAASASSATPTAPSVVPSATSDPCSSGRCVPPGKKQECLVLNKVWAWRALSSPVYLPVDVRGYFADRFTAKYDPAVFPTSLRNASDLVDLFGNAPWSLFATQGTAYMTAQAGCKIPRQRYYLTAAMADLVLFYKQKGDPCSVDAQLNLCADTWDDRAASIQGDLSNTTYCPNQSPEFLAAGAKYVQTMKVHPFRSTDSSCLSGLAIEKDVGHCGWYSEYATCLHADSCADMPGSLRVRCPQILATYSASQNDDAKASDSAGGDSTKQSGHVTAIVLGVIAALIVGAGFFALRRARGKRQESLTSKIARTVGRNNPMAPSAGMPSFASHAASSSPYSPAPSSFVYVQAAQPVTEPLLSPANDPWAALAASSKPPAMVPPYQATPPPAAAHYAAPPRYLAESPAPYAPPMQQQAQTPLYMPQPVQARPGPGMMDRQGSSDPLLPPQGPPQY